MSLQSFVDLRIRSTQTTALDLAITRAAALDKIFTDELATGVGADQADVIFADERTLTASATEDLDLAGGGLTDILGVAFAPAKVKLIFVEADAANNIANNVNVQRAAANGVPFMLAAGDGWAIKPGGCALFYAPTLAGSCSVTAGTGDLITLTNSAGTNSVVYRIVIIGTSA